MSATQNWKHADHMLWFFFWYNAHAKLDSLPEMEADTVQSPCGIGGDWSYNPWQISKSKDVQFFYLKKNSVWEWRNGAIGKLLATQGPEFRSPAHKCLTRQWMSKPGHQRLEMGRSLELIGQLAYLTESVTSKFSETVSLKIRLTVVEEDIQCQLLTSTDMYIHKSTHKYTPMYTIV